MNKTLRRPNNIWGVVRHTPPRARLAATVPLTHRGATTAERGHRAKDTQPPTYGGVVQVLLTNVKIRSGQQGCKKQKQVL